MPEQRTLDRLPCRFRTFYRTDQTPSWWWCTVEDVSPSGMRLRTARPLDRGTPLDLDLALPELRRARVVHQELAEVSAYRVGCTFSCELSEDEFSALQQFAETQNDLSRCSE